LAGMRDSLNHSKQGPQTTGPGGHNDHAGEPFVFKNIFTPENIWALVLFLIVVALIVFTTNDSPVWIYQGF
jgi:hypothetical protein